MATITVAEAQAHLSEIIANLGPGDEVVLTRDEEAVATIKATAPSTNQRKLRELGTLQGTVTHMAPDFDAIPEGFEEYLP